MDDVEYEYQGRVWILPAALVALQIELVQAHVECVRWLEDRDNLATARANYLELVEKKFRIARPWQDTFENHDRWYADWALKDYAAKRTAELGQPAGQH